MKCLICIPSLENNKLVGDHLKKFFPQVDFFSGRKNNRNILYDMKNRSFFKLDHNFLMKTSGRQSLRSRYFFYEIKEEHTTFLKAKW
jgi:hypothetical protein